MKIKKLFAVLLIVALVSMLGVTAFAADQAFYFSMVSSTTTPFVYTSTYNKKLYTNDNATIKLQHNTANDYYGYRLALVDSSFTESTYARWFTSNSSTSYPPYLSGMAVYGMNYYMSGRVDSDLGSDVYQCYGYYNSDVTY